MEFCPSLSHTYSPVNVGNDKRGMSRKRTLHPTDAPLAKRYLNGALAAELRGLRISGTPIQSEPSVRNAFGVSFAPSTFYTPNFDSNNVSPTFAQCPNGVAFGDDFVRSLQSEPTPFAQKISEVPQPVVTDPDSSDSSSGSVTMSDVEYEHGQILNDASGNAVEDVTIEECDTEPSSENRLIVYRPPVRTSGNLVSRMNAVLPDTRSILRNPKTNEWMFVARSRPDNAKRKLALVPWEGDPQKKLCDSLGRPTRVIPMPWHDNATSDTIVETIDESTGVSYEDMKIEELSL
ncbi:hypothetical protein BWQ96_02117 [Gracilariopsis chorda]|uniref:Uncharacterized protein n=1 Tax=Gracilariopsis chorda TaxID=448386 RepID=A0A2V3J1G4_9FLOR|nr:hypothetical protein BWQ96_02117 [Gracilariopsis chorda]|eukprot:PXF48165.1 hypothetical protein BWQ96_02117 [Gracilariopsis chorda]